MINTFKLRKYAAILTCGCLPAILLTVGSSYYGLLWGGIAFFLIGLVLILPVGVIFLKNPFSQMLEGHGLLTINLDSTGVLQVFIMGVRQPYIGGKLGKKVVEDVFDRESILHLAKPKKALQKAEGLPGGGLRIELSEDELNKGRFALYHYPVIIYNQQTGTVITKDWLGEKEKTAFAEHSILYMNRRVEELSAHVRDFGRAVVELIKPGKNILNRWWLWAIIFGIFIFVMLLLFGQPIMDAISGFAGTTGEALRPAQGGSVTPR